MILPPQLLTDEVLERFVARDAAARRSGAATSAPSSLRIGWPSGGSTSCARAAAAIASPPRWTSSTRTPSGRCGRRSPRSRTAASEAEDVVEAVDGDLSIRCSRRDRGRRDPDRLRRHRGAVRRQPQLPARGHEVGLLLRRPLPHRARPARLRRRLRAGRRHRAGGLPRQRAPARGRRRRQHRDLARASSTSSFAALGEARARARGQGQGTMNNVALGNDGFTYYETIGGGQGACPDADGPSRRPRRDVEHARRRRRRRSSSSTRCGSSAGSCGAAPAVRAARRGGDGVVRELRVLEDCRLSVLAERRRHAPPGRRRRRATARRAAPSSTARSNRRS